MMRFASARALITLTIACGAAGAVLLPAGCETYSPVCPDDTVEEDRDDDCPFVPPGGPQRKRADRCEVAFDTNNCTVTFRDDVFPVLVGPLAQRSGGGCTLPNCHGPNTQGGGVLLLPLDSTPDQLYNAMAGFKNDSGDPYVEAATKNASLLGSLKGTL